MIKVCNTCKKEFIVIDGKRTFKTCENCRRKRRRSVKESRDKKKLEYRKIYGFGNIDDTIKEMNEYNKINGTNLTYGKYSTLKELGLLKNIKK